MNNLEIRKIATAIYLKEDIDLSQYDEADRQAILEDLSVVRVLEDKANDVWERRQLGDLPDFSRRFCYGL